MAIVVVVVGTGNAQLGAGEDKLHVKDSPALETDSYVAVLCHAHAQYTAEGYQRHAACKFSRRCWFFVVVEKPFALLLFTFRSLTKQHQTNKKSGRRNPHFKELGDHSFFNAIFCLVFKAISFVPLFSRSIRDCVDLL